jgi:hypothetical protein
MRTATNLHNRKGSYSFDLPTPSWTSTQNERQKAIDSHKSRTQGDQGGDEKKEYKRQWQMFPGHSQRPASTNIVFGDKIFIFGYAK